MHYEFFLHYANQYFFHWECYYKNVQICPHFLNSSTFWAVNLRQYGCFCYFCVALLHMAGFPAPADRCLHTVRLADVKVRTTTMSSSSSHNKARAVSAEVKRGNTCAPPKPFDSHRKTHNISVTNDSNVYINTYSRLLWPANQLLHISLMMCHAKAALSQQYKVKRCRKHIW